MTHRLLGGGSDGVRITGRAKAKSTDLIDAGAHWHDSQRSLATGAGMILLVLPDLPEVDDVLNGPDGILAAKPTDLILVISSTSSPDGVRALDARLRSETAGRGAGRRCPVSGGTDGAAAGKLSIVVGGNDHDVARALPVLSACGTPVHLGPLGAGEVAKACNQMIVAATIMALGEAAVLADRSGLDLVALFDLLGGGYAGSRILETRGDRIVGEDYSPVRNRPVHGQGSRVRHRGREPHRDTPCFCLPSRPASRRR